MDFSFFITNNRSGHKTKESWFLKNHPEEYKNITNYTSGKIPDTSTFREKIWLYCHNLPGRPKCCGCDNNVKFSERFDRGYGDFCSLTCANNNQDILNERIKKSNQEKYGVDFYTQHGDFITKQKKTKKERYGDENYNNVEKMKRTKITLYGNSLYNNSDKNRSTRRDSFINTLKDKTNDVFISYNLDDDNIILNCSICKKDYQIYNNLFNYRTKQGSVLCTNCNTTDDKQTSGLEKNLSLFVSTLIPIEIKNRKLLNGKEVDILIPEHNIAIEFNGLFWHSDLFLDKDYHLNKTKLAHSKGYDLIHVFEDEWLNTPDIIKSIIKSKLGLVDTKVYARKCEIKEINTKEEKTFLFENHIQGFVGSKVAYGLYYNNELISVMSFGGLRKALGHKTQEGHYEMLRFCNKLNTTVVGGASRLFKYFIKEFNPKKVVSYSDKRYFNGETYKKLGFNSTGETKPNYYYTLKHNKYNRYMFRKDILVSEGFDKNKTEKEIMKERGYNRIYDCGNIRWVYGD